MAGPMNTPNVQRVWDEVHKRWPDVKSLGVTNCRLIKNTATWSQHSWANAWDISSPSRVLVFGPRTMVNPLHMAYMDRIYEHLNANRLTYQLRNILWRQSAHWDHIHVDHWPKGVSIPPCAGGPLKVQNKDGTYSDTFGEEDLSKETEGLQRNLNAAGFTDPNGEPLKVDGDYGAKTEYAHLAIIRAAAVPTIEQHRHGLATSNITGPIYDE